MTYPPLLPFFSWPNVRFLMKDVVLFAASVYFAEAGCARIVASTKHVREVSAGVASH
jgi:hypothetical protein